MIKGDALLTDVCTVAPFHVHLYIIYTKLQKVLAIHIYKLTTYKSVNIHNIFLLFRSLNVVICMFLHGICHGETKGKIYIVDNKVFVFVTMIPTVWVNVLSFSLRLKV